MADAEGRPTDSYELNEQLASTIGAAVEQLLGMGGTEADNMNIDAAIQAARTGNLSPGQPGAGGGEAPSGAGQPGDPKATGSAAPASVTAQEGEIDWESTKAVNGLYLGKYKTRADAVRGVAHTVAMAKTAFSQRDEFAVQMAALRQENEQLRVRPVAAPVTVSQSAPAAPTRGVTAEPALNFGEVLSKFRDGNLDEESLTAFASVISEQAAQRAAQVAREERAAEIAAAKAESARWAKVEDFMAENAPESMNYTDELALFIKSHPLIGAGVQALIAQDRHEEATLQAWEALRPTLLDPKLPAPKPFVPAPATRENIEKEVRLDAADQVRREAVEQARRDAGVVGSGAAGRGVHESADLGPSQDEYENSVALMRQGDGAKWRSLVFRDSLNHPIFNGM